MIRERIKLVNKLHWCLYLPEMLLLKIFISLSAPPLTMIWGSAQLQHKTWSVCPFKSNKGVLQARTSHIFSKESCDPETNMWSFPWHQFTLVIHPWNKEFIKNISKMKIQFFSIFLVKSKLSTAKQYRTVVFWRIFS